MATFINNNTTAFMATTNLNMNSSNLSKDIQRLSTGLRINSAADDPAGLVIAENLAAQVSGVTQATANSNDAINEIKTAEGALNQVQSLLISMRQLAVNASNLGVNDTTNVQADQTQIASAIQSINQISATTQFGTKKLLDGSATNAGTTTAGSVAVSAATGQTATILTQGRWSASNAQTAGSIVVTGATYANATSAAAGAVSGALTASSGYQGNVTINGVNYAVGSSSQTGTTPTITFTDTFTGLTGLNSAIASSGYQASITGGKLVLTSTTSGATSNQSINLSGLYANATTGTLVSGPAATDSNHAAADQFDASALTVTNGTNASATIGGTLTSAASTVNGSSTTFNFSNGFSFATATLTPATTAATATVGTATSTSGTTTSGTTLEYQIGANEGQTSAVNIQSTAADQLGLNTGSYTDANGATQTVTTDSIADLNVTSFKGAQDAIAVLDNAISQVSTLRANLGAFQTNVLQSNVTSLGVDSTNLQASQSSVQNADLASTVTSYTKDQILVQSATSALSYANQMPQYLLKLLQ